MAIIAPMTYLQVIQAALRLSGFDPTSFSFDNPVEARDFLVKRFVWDVINEIYEVRQPLAGWKWAACDKTATYSWTGTSISETFATIQATITDIDEAGIKSISLSSSYDYQPLKHVTMSEYLEDYKNGIANSSYAGTPSKFIVQHGSLYIYPCLADTITIRYSALPDLPVLSSDTITAIPAKWHTTIIYGVAAYLSSYFADPTFENNQKFYELQLQTMIKQNNKSSQANVMMVSGLFT